MDLESNIHVYSEFYVCYIREFIRFIIEVQPYIYNNTLSSA